MFFILFILEWYGVRFFWIYFAFLLFYVYTYNSTLLLLFLWGVYWMLGRLMSDCYLSQSIFKNLRFRGHVLANSVKNSEILGFGRAWKHFKSGCTRDLFLASIQSPLGPSNYRFMTKKLNFKLNSWPRRNPH